jgi:hypothetical protein
MVYAFRERPKPESKLGKLYRNLRIGKQDRHSFEIVESYIWGEDESRKALRQ